MRQYNAVKVAEAIVPLLLNARADLLNRWKWVFISINWWKAVCAIPNGCSKTFVSLLFIFRIFHHFFHTTKTEIRPTDGRANSNRQSTERIQTPCLLCTVRVHSPTHPPTHTMAHNFALQSVHCTAYLSVCRYIIITALKVIDTNIKLIFANSKIND